MKHIIITVPCGFTRTYTISVIRFHYRYTINRLWYLWHERHTQIAFEYFERY